MPPDLPTVRRKYNKSTLILPLLMVISMIVWGGSWVSAKILAQRLTPEILSFWRFLLSFVAFIPFIFILPGPIRFNLKGFVYSALGAISMSLYMYFFFIGLESWFAGYAGVFVTSMIPLMTFLLSLALYRKGSSSTEIIGLALGMTGAAILLRLWEFDSNLFLSSDNLLLILCPALWAVLTICSQRAAESISIYIFSFVTYGLSTLLFLPSAIDQGIWVVLNQDMEFWFNMFFLSVLSGTVATTIFFVAAEKLGAYHASSYAFLVPLSALMLSWVFLGETPEISTIIGGTIAIIAVYMINRGKAAKE
jgi:drug/metabolite transporter (DMT)-like permease